MSKMQNSSNDQKLYIIKNSKWLLKEIWKNISKILKDQKQNLFIYSSISTTQHIDKTLERWYSLEFNLIYHFELIK